MQRLRWVALAALLIQAVLLFSNLDLLPLWLDEAFTIRAVQSSLPEMFTTLQGDLHPPLYFLAQRVWLRVGPARTLVENLRMLSAAFALTASAYAMWLFLPRLSQEGAAWFCALLALSPCLLLYGRMARSYSLQLLVTLIALEQLRRLLQEPENRRRAIAFGLALAVVLYTHYVPGFAMVAAANGMLLIRTRRFLPLVLPNVVAALAYSPWIVSSMHAAGEWVAQSESDPVTNNAFAGQVVKLGYWGWSFLFGESVPWWLFFAGLILGAALAWLAILGTRGAGEWRAPAAVLAGIGYMGVSRAVSYPFIPARMIFVLPFAYLLLVGGAGAKPAVGRLLLSAMLIVCGVSVWSYFRVENFLNRDYAGPFKDIVHDIRTTTRPTVVAVGPFTNPNVLRYYLAGEIPIRRIRPPESAEDAAGELAKGPWSRICFVRNTHDTSATAFYARFEATLSHHFPQRDVHYYGMQTRLDGMLISALLGRKDTVPYFYEIIEFRR